MSPASAFDTSPAQRSERGASRAAGLHHVASHPERADEREGEKVGAGEGEGPDLDGELGEHHDAQHHSEHVPWAAAVQVQMGEG